MTLIDDALALTSGAKVRHGVDVLDTSGNPTSLSLPFSKGSVTWSYRPPDPLAGQQHAITAVRRQATLTVPGDIGIEPLDYRFRLWTEWLLSDGTWNRWHLGVYVATAPKLDDDAIVVTRSLSLADVSWIWSQAKLTDPIHLDATQAAIPWVVSDLGTRFGVTSFAISGDQAATVGGNGLTFESDTDLLTVYSTVLGSVGNDALTTDAEGAAASQPLSVLAGKGPMAVFGAGARKITAKGSVSPLQSSLPNEVRFVARQGPASGGTEGNGIYTVKNQSTGPSSIDSRGFTVSISVQVDATDQATLESVGDAQKQRYFAGGGSTLSGSLGLSPAMGDQDVLTVNLPRLGVSGDWICTQWTYPLGDFSDSSSALMPFTAEKRIS